MTPSTRFPGEADGAFVPVEFSSDVALRGPRAAAGGRNGRAHASAAKELVIARLGAVRAAWVQRFATLADRLDALQGVLAPGSEHDSSWQSPSIGVAGLS